MILTARNEQRGLEAVSKLHEIGLSNVVFHQLDVLDPVSIHSLAEFIADKFGRLDILVSFQIIQFHFSHLDCYFKYWTSS